jgi:TonB family protein
MLTALQVAKTMSAICIVQTAIGILAAQDIKPLPSPSPGQAIEDAARASAPASVQKKSGNIEIISDTHGIDFGPYLQAMLATVRRNWYSLIPASAQTQKGEVTIEFKILQTGHLKDMQLVTSSGSMSLDRAAWGSIAGSEPFKPLPEEFHGPYLALRFHYAYNPEKLDLEHPDDVIPSRSGSTKLQHATLLDHDADANTIRYPERAKRDKIDGIVRLVARIAPDGTVESVAAVEGNDLLGDAASQAIRKWHFQPATENGKPVEDQVRIRVEFRIDSKAIRFEVFPWQTLTDTNLK